MAISGTYLFNPDVAEIMEEAFERAGADLRNAHHIRTARRSLNLISLEWQNEGINLWTVDEQSIPASTITAGTATYNVDINTIGILDAVIRTDAGDADSQSDLTVSRMSTSEYSQITSKLTQGRPLQYWFRRIGVRGGTSGGSNVNPTVTFWPVPDESSKYTFVYWRMRRISDMGSMIDNTVDYPDRFIPALISCLAWHLYEKMPAESIRPDKMARLEAKKNYDFLKASEEDREKVDLLVTPDLSMYR